MGKKKIDNRVRTLIENCVALHQRSVFVLVGDRGRDQVVNLHYLLSKSSVRARPSVLWAYKKELGFSTHRKKRMKEIKKKIKAGLIDPEKDDPFELFISATDIRYCYYSETHKVLGSTYGMCVLQDFEAVTPSLLARTIETVEGGGIIVILLRSVASLKQLYTLSMDVHSRYVTEAHKDVVPRFNERFLLSLKGGTQSPVGRSLTSGMPTCLLMDDKLDVLPWARQTLNIEPVPPRSKAESESEDAKQLKDIQQSLVDTQPAGSLVAKAKTFDQAKVILSFLEAISEKTLRSTVTLTAARGRGKSAAMGLAIAGAVAYSYSSIYVTSPSPENLKTLFEFIFKGFDAIGLEEHTDYELVQSTNPEFNKAIVRVNIFQDSHRQTIQYIQPQDAQKLGTADLLVIDEAAAIPLTLVRELLGPYVVFMASTVNGYEGTGRSLSLKLISQLRKESSGLGSQESKEGSVTSASGSRVLRELTLEMPIRYAAGDPVEAWLNQLLCLDISTIPSAPVNRDTLFSYNKVSELFLQRLMSLYVASHYKNTPDDLQLLSDAPAHRIFVLLPKIDPSSQSLPEILCVVQIALEGEISKESVSQGLRRGIRASGDLIPWTVSQQFQDPDFAQLSGARVVRIATHPDYQGMGYGRQTVKLLREFYQGQAASLAETPKKSKSAKSKRSASQDAELKPRTDLPPLLSRLSELQPEPLDYLGVSYGATQQLYKFWKTCGFSPVYVRQTANTLTGEHTCIMLSPLSGDGQQDWSDTYWLDFRRRFMSLLGFTFKHFSTKLSLNVLERSKDISTSLVPDQPLSYAQLLDSFTVYDLKRLKAYANQMVDFHVVMDLTPTIARLWFLNKIPVSLSPLQRAVLLVLGLQHKTVDDLHKDLNYAVDVSQLIANFSQVIRKVSKYFSGIQESHTASSLPSVRDVAMKPVGTSLHAQQEKDAEGVMDGIETFGEEDPAFAEAVSQIKGAPTTISVKRPAPAKEAEPETSSSSHKKKKKRRHSGEDRRSKKTRTSKK